MDRTTHELVVVDLETEHNHERTEGVYKHFPQKRKLEKEDAQVIKLVLKTRANRKHVQQHILDSSGRIYYKGSLRDLQNIANTLKEGSGNDLHEVLTNHQSDPG